MLEESCLIINSRRLNCVQGDFNRTTLKGYPSRPMIAERRRGVKVCTKRRKVMMRFSRIRNIAKNRTIAVVASVREHSFVRTRVDSPKLFLAKLSSVDRLISRSVPVFELSLSSTLHFRVAPRSGREKFLFSFPFCS